MPRRVAVDAGSIVALFDQDDAHHTRAVRFLKGFRGEFLSNVAVATEAVFLLDFSREAQLDFLSWVVAGAITLADVTVEDLRRIRELFTQYADLPADFADVALVAQCERFGIDEIATVDKDFRIYRLHGKRPFRMVL